MKRGEVLIVGINSFLGKAIYELVKDEFFIIGVYHKNTDNLPKDIEVINASSIHALKGRKFTCIYLVSAYVPTAEAFIDDEKLVNANVFLPRDISTLFPVSRIVFCSSVAVYENITANEPIVAHELPAPSSKYALSKLWGEAIIDKHSSYAILRISSMYGIGMATTTFIPKIIENALVNKQLVLQGKGERMQNYIHVNDVAKIAVKSAQQTRNFTALAVSDQSYTNKEIAEVIKELEPEITLNFSGVDSSPSKIYNNDFTHQVLGRINFIPIKEGLKELVQWTKKRF